MEYTFTEKNFQSEVRGCTLYVDDDDEVTIGPY